MKGACLCGAVSVEVAGAPEHQPEACHCAQCRRQTSHVFVGVNVRRDHLSVRGDENVRWYRSSATVERGFCATCGSALFWKPTIPGYEFTSVAMGLFDPPTGLRLAKHTFVGEKSDYYELCDGLPQRSQY
jgi:hypothetical protein